jgi:hypothetical protein
MNPSTKRVSFPAFFCLWAQLQRWHVPELHMRICEWLEQCRAPVRVLLVFRGAAKSTIYAVYKAWCLYCDPSGRSLIWAADDKLATKLTRDTLSVLRRHPLCGGMLGSKPGAQSFWVTGAQDARNPSMEAVGVSSNATGSRADALDFDDIEVPKNIKTAEARANLRIKVEESTHIAVPGSQTTYIGTPHTHDSVYTEQIEAGAQALKIPLFARIQRIDPSLTATRFKLDFGPHEDGYYVLAGIGRFARLLHAGPDYRIEGDELVFAEAPRVGFDVCTGNAWPERFTRKDIEQRRRGTRTLNAWDSQYHLEAKPIDAVRLDPARLRVYAEEPVVREANNTVAMFLGSSQIVGAVAYWDCSLGKVKSDASAFVLLLTDARGNLYWHLNEALVGELADFDEKGRIVSGQCEQIRGFVVKYQIPVVQVETNGPGGFVPPILRRALQGTGCGVVDVWSTVNKNKRILDAIEPPLSSRFLWCHIDVWRGPLPAQMRDFNPAATSQPDDFLDAGAGAISSTPVRIGKPVRQSVRNRNAPARQDWRPTAGSFEVTLEP